MSKFFSKPQAVFLLASLFAGVTGCGDPGEEMSWEEFRELSAREVNGETIYVVEWDLALSLEELHEY
jgi:hypothetical protein